MYRGAVYRESRDRADNKKKDQKKEGWRPFLFIFFFDVVRVTFCSQPTLTQRSLTVFNKFLMPVRVALYIGTRLPPHEQIPTYVKKGRGMDGWMDVE